MTPERLGRLVDDHAAALVLYARQWTAAAEDVVQEAFLKLVAAARPPDNPVPWLYRVVRNAAISAARSAERRRRHETAAAGRTPAWFLPAENAALDAKQAAAALQMLPDEEREAVVASLWGGLTFAEIGGLMGCSTS